MQRKIAPMVGANVLKNIFNKIEIFSKTSPDSILATIDRDVFFELQILFYFSDAGSYPNLVGNGQDAIFAENNDGTLSLYTDHYDLLETFKKSFKSRP